ncbi:hypothetical protein AAP_04281 [Ascosphaera apis ARSEF 7405]|uniref:Uncharacterized protein n=1 Tax=Ascosphaera apis ARSEF 7405 TaxID=392613 RepID=A0A167X1Q9_9EURO|nr:hypothetical protein AAP_04281 [Ascosphaera apis ARSEF 7405]
MQRLISRTGLSSYTGRNLSGLSFYSPSSNAVTRRTATAASRRLVIGNAVTAFYSTIFAVAVLFDIQMKGQQVEQWQKQLDTVKAEMLELQNEEARLLQNLEARRKVRQLALPMQRRQYSTQAPRSQYSGGTGFLKRRTAVQAPAVGPAMSTSTSDSTSPDIKSDSIDASRPHTKLFPHITVPSPESTHLPQDISEILDFGSNETEDPFQDEEFEGNRDYSSGDALREEAIRRLAVRQLAIKLLLRPRIAHTYGSTPRQDQTELQLPRNSTGDLLDELASVKKKIRSLKYERNASFNDILDDTMNLARKERLRQEREELSLELRALVREHLEAKLSLTDLILLIAKNLLSSEEPIPSADITLLVTHFTRTRQNDLVRMVLETLLPNKFDITVSVIVSSINYFNKARDLFGFDGFIRFLQGLSSPVNIPVLWRTVDVHGVEVAIPGTSRYPWVMNALIAAALSFDQPQRAHAWLHLLRETGYAEGPEVLGSYLRWYSVTPNWEKGRHILLRSLAYLMSTAAFTQNTTERLILYMIIFCNCSGKHELSYEIVTAAAKHGFDWHASFNKRDIRLSVRLATKQWKLAQEKSQHMVAEDRPIEERCYDFAKSIESSIQKAVNEPFVNEIAQKAKYNKKRELSSFRLRYAEQALDSNGHHHHKHTRTKLHKPMDPSIKSTASTEPDLQRRIDFITYSLKISDLTIDDFRMELDMEARQAQLSRLQQELATLKDSVDV